MHGRRRRRRACVLCDPDSQAVDQRGQGVAEAIDLVFRVVVVDAGADEVIHGTQLLIQTRSEARTHAGDALLCCKLCHQLRRRNHVRKKQDDA